MDTIIVKIFATALALFQVTTTPETLKTVFDAERDQPQVAQIIVDGCASMRKAFDIEDINLSELIETALQDPQAFTGENRPLQGLNLADLSASYRQFCNRETLEKPPVDLGQVIQFYNKAAANLPDHTVLKGFKLPSMVTVLDRSGRRFSEIFEPDNRRVVVPLSDIPDVVQKAFIAAEDKRFFEHKGIDQRALVRAFFTSFGNPGRPQGGSTITQQLAKNLLVGDDLSYERKIREMIVASRIESTLSKEEILGLYLNTIYLGRASWGVELAAQSYFGKKASQLTLAEGVMLSALTKGPNFYNPDREPERVRQRVAYVLTRMQEDGYINGETLTATLKETPQRVAFKRERPEVGFHAIDQISREAKAMAGLERLTDASYIVQSTLLSNLQRETEVALQDGLARFESSVGRVQFLGPEMNIAQAVRRIEAERKSGEPAWLQAFENARIPLYDVHWIPAVLVEKSRTKNGGEIVRVGLKDGRVLPLNVASATIRKKLNLHDVVFVRVVQTKAKTGPVAELRIRPKVQGAIVVLENKTGRILSMAGGFSYPLSQLNRTTQSYRQPGSAFKPMTYLAALGTGLQPNTLIQDSPVTLPPIGGGMYVREKDYWTPKNYDSGVSGPITLRRALENSKNLVTARLLDGVISADPEASLKRVCELSQEAKLYTECVPHYPFVLGAQPLRVVDLAAFYAAVANEGVRPQPHVIEKIENNGRVVYEFKAQAPRLGSADRVAFYQLKTMLQGVMERGTARAYKHLAPFVGGKTGTTDNENDAWFVGFTNDVTIAVWVGYDNADGKRRTLGGGQTGSKVALPIFNDVLKAAWAHHAPQAKLAPPSLEVQQRTIALPIDINTGERLNEASSQQAFTEYFRLDRIGEMHDTQYRHVAREEAYASRYSDPYMDGERSWGWNSGAYGQNYGQQQFQQSPWFRSVPSDQTPPPGAYRSQNVHPYWLEEERRRRARRVDPDYFWGYGRRF